MEAGVAPHPNHPGLHQRESVEPKGKPCWKNRALHHRPGIAAQLLIIGNASLARRKECCDLMLIFYPATFIPGRSSCTQARPFLGWEEVARQTNGLYLGKEEIF